jgi:Tol biopolymer transport system component
MAFDGSQIQVLLGDPRSNFTYPRPCWGEEAKTATRLGDPRYIVFDWVGHGSNLQSDAIWRADPDGSNPLRLSNGETDTYPLCSPDGQTVLFLDYNALEIKRVPVAGGVPEVVPGGKINGASNIGVMGISPDGKMLAIPVLSGSGSSRPSWWIALLPLDAGPSPRVRRLELQPPLDDESVEVGFAADGKALLYESAKNGVGNLWVRPFDGGPSRQLTHFTSEESAGFRLSPDGQTILMVRRHTDSDVVLLHDSNAPQ